MRLHPLFPLVLLTMSTCDGQHPPSVRAGDVQTYDTEAGGPMDAARALGGMKLAEGFTATLFAAEPMVRQPIDMKIDARGRVWVAESYGYMAPMDRAQDRITVLEDTDGDGIADKRTVFAGGFQRLTSIETGYGGIWVLAPPRLLFIPDADGDLKPDGPARTHVTGWNSEAKWNMANGLAIGPDGWIYGGQGQMGSSTPQAAATGRTAPRISGGIWRYHPGKGKIEAYAHGMTNPWGLDWNADGELFCSGNCNGHIWHVVGGTLFEWGFGARHFPSEYGRTPPIQAAPHYAPAKDWVTAWDQRYEMQEANNEFGGGHSHSGLLICIGSDWPERMRGHTLMSNIHGHRINEDTLEPDGGTYISRRVGDPVLPADPWFRGVSVKAAPDGAFFVSDWSDTGECHDKDGIHQNSGRIYRIVPLATRPVPPIDTMDGAELIAQLEGDFEQAARQAQRELQHRARIGTLGRETLETIASLLENGAPQVRMRALGVLHGGGIATTNQLVTASRDADVSVRSMAVRFIGEMEHPLAAAHLAEMAREESSPRVLLHLASTARLLPAHSRRGLIDTLIGRADPPLADRVLQLIWHIQIQDPSFHSGIAGEQLAICHAPVFASYLARYLVENEGAQGFRRIMQAAARSDDPAAIVVAAVTLAREQYGVLDAPPDWPATRRKWMSSPDAALRGAALSAAILFGDRDALDALRLRISDPAASLEAKSEALETLAATRSVESIEVIGNAYRDKDLRLAAIRALRHFPQQVVAEKLIQAWRHFDGPERTAAAATLVTRKEWALALLRAIGEGTVPKESLDATQARDLASSGDAALRQAVLDHWGDPERSSEEKEREIARIAELLKDLEAGDPKHGREIYAQRCGACHVLFGEGGAMGPDLTGRNRADVTTLLRSIVDPAADVPEDGRLSVVTRKDGSIASGIIVSRNEKQLILHGTGGETRVNSGDVANVLTLPSSPMPEGLLNGLDDRELLDLFSYLRADQGAPPK